jgi:hypothetical protein
MVDLDVWLGSKSELIFVPVSTVVSCFSFWGPPEERRVLRDIHGMQIVETPQSGKNLNPSSREATSTKSACAGGRPLIR